MLQRPSILTLTLVALGIGFCAWSMILERPSLDYARQDNPVAIAIAFDISPSMLAIPDPAFDRDTPPRYIRARSVLLEFLRILRERRESVIVALIGYTRNAEILMGWDNAVSQLEEIIEFGLSPGLHSSTGTSIEAAVAAVIDLFGMLPLELRDTGRKLAVFVTDGEDTLPRSFLGYAVEELATESFDIVALHAGLLDANEGVPSYGQVGEFLGFEAMGGDLYTVPDAEAMRAIADATSGRGLYVRAEDPAAADKILRFVVNSRNDNIYPDNRLLAVLAMFLVVSVLSARVIQ